MSEQFVEGWTTPVKAQLKKDGAPFNATGMQVAIELRDRDGNVVTEGGTTDWLDATQSIVLYTPIVGDLTYARSPMRVRFKVTAGAEVAWFPRSSSHPTGVSEEQWIIGRP